MKIRDRIKELRRVRASELMPNPQNWRKHPEAQANALRGILAEVGIADAVLARETPEGLQLLDGHLRAEIAPDAMMPVLVLDVDEAEARKILATHDTITGMAETDHKLLAELVKQAELVNEDIDKMLADVLKSIEEEPKDESINPDPEEDDFLPPADDEEIKTTIQAGDLIMLGPHRLLCGDSTDAESVAYLMDNAKADMLLTDPPYGVAYAGKRVKREAIKNDELDEQSLSTLVRQAFDIADSQTRDGSYWYATVPPGPLQLIFANDWKSRGILRQILVWSKNMFVISWAEYHYQHELILFGWKSGARHKNKDRTRTSVWNFAKPHSSREHPTMKPVELWANAINDGSRRGEIVLDIFCGSGTTIIAADQLDRVCYAMEISPKYCQVIVDRFIAYRTKAGKDAVVTINGEPYLSESVDGRG